MLFDRQGRNFGGLCCSHLQGTEKKTGVVERAVTGKTGRAQGCE
jgi:hypothetical protein